MQGAEMSQEILSKVKKQLEEIDTLFKDALKQEILPDRTYTQIVTKLGHLETNYMRDDFKSLDLNYFNWVKTRLEKISDLLIHLQKHSTSSFSLPNEDLMHVTGDYYNEDNSVTLTAEVKQAINSIINEAYHLKP
jgi:hypothetical protein